eukprot:7029996-Pyramimonas_sp.AAC.2
MCIRDSRAAPPAWQCWSCPRPWGRTPAAAGSVVVILIRRFRSDGTHRIVTRLVLPSPVGARAP